MLPLLAALLLAALFLHPWSAGADAGYVNQAEAASEQTQVAAPAHSVPLFSGIERLEEIEARAFAPAPAPAPTPEPSTAPPAVPAATPVPAPKPLPASSLSSAEIQALVCSYAWPCDQALHVMWCESGGRPTAIGRGSNYGLFQINQVHARHIAGFWDTWMDPAANTQWAFEIWSRSGWRPWACRPR